MSSNVNFYNVLSAALAATALLAVSVLAYHWERYDTLLVASIIGAVLVAVGGLAYDMLLGREEGVESQSLRSMEDRRSDEVESMSSRLIIAREKGDQVVVVRDGRYDESRDYGEIGEVGTDFLELFKTFKPGGKSIRMIIRESYRSRTSRISSS